jgi:hypothetical protein
MHAPTLKSIARGGEFQQAKRKNIIIHNDQISPNARKRGGKSEIYFL